MQTSEVTRPRENIKGDELIKLVDLSYIADSHGPFTAQVCITIGGTSSRRIGKSTESMLDAFADAIQQMFPHSERLVAYRAYALTEGTKTSIEVALTLRNGKHIEHRGIGTNTDPVNASALAYINSLNMFQSA